MSSSEEEFVTKCVKRKRRKICSNDAISSSVNLYSHSVAPTLNKSKITAFQLLHEQHKLMQLEPKESEDIPDSDSSGEVYVVKDTSSVSEVCEVRCITPPPVCEMPQMTRKEKTCLQRKGNKLLRNVKSMLDDARNAQSQLDISIDNNNSVIECIDDQSTSF
uniref:Uncharacterized protein n=1 Tax=Ciona savignyi TaxID=51511 RepID=H2ZCQ2_CIOSA